MIRIPEAFTDAEKQSAIRKSKKIDSGVRIKKYDSGLKVLYFIHNDLYD